MVLLNEFIFFLGDKYIKDRKWEHEFLQPNLHRTKWNVISILHFWRFSGGGTLNSSLRDSSRHVVGFALRSTRSGLSRLTLRSCTAQCRVQGPWAGPDAEHGADARAREKMRRLVLFAMLAGVLVATGKTCTRPLYFGLLARARADLMDVNCECLEKWARDAWSGYWSLFLVSEFGRLLLFCLDKVGFRLDDVQGLLTPP